VFDMRTQGQRLIEPMDSSAWLGARKAPLLSHVLSFAEGAVRIMAALALGSNQLHTVGDR
jgi:hypothetical protein